MTRPLYTWMIFGLCLAVLIAAMGWVSMTALRLDRAEVAARHQAEVEENVRLALWRMESAAAPLIAQESSRPLAAFQPSSVLLAKLPDKLLLHFQLDPDGRLISPQVPVSGGKGAPQPSVADSSPARNRLAELEKAVRYPELIAALPASIEPGAQVRVLSPPQVPTPQQANASLPPPPGQSAAEPQTTSQVPVPQQQEQIYESGQQAWSPQRQQVKSSNEQRIREQNIVQFAFANAPPEPTAGPLKPLWLSDRLLLARRAVLGGQECIQGCWVDWPALKASLLGGIADLLPRADLVPANAAAGSTRMLAALPIELVPGVLPGDGSGEPSPVRLSLVVAWTGVLLAAAAVAVLMRAALVLSERRGAFVSAVTHELRTPLTTFRMYTDMLTAGMVPDESKRRRYLETLRQEADRLSHLVENVLAYARLEQNRPARRPEVLTVSDLLTRVSPRLRERAGAAELELRIEPGVRDDGRWVRADPSAVEQILFNLVDNACKYAAIAEDRTIHVESTELSAAVGLRVRDHGPGISASDARRLFRPFSKSSQQAANSAPGVGLGLALSRRLARAMGGDLILENAIAGCSFLLKLPASEPQS